MLNSLFIQNYAIIDELNIEFTDGLTVITGETGAGKSILLGALGLVMGNRADTNVLFDKSVKCIVEAQYHIGAYELKKFFKENDLDYDDICIIRREISPSSKSRAFINDSPVLLETVRSLSGRLLDLHQQFDTLELNQEEFQITALDSLGENTELMRQYSVEFKKYQSLNKRLQHLIAKSESAKQEEEYLKFQLKEFEGLELNQGELERLEAEQQRYSKGEDIIRTGGLIAEALDGLEDSIIERLENLLREIGALKEIDAKATSIHERIYSAIEELRDISSLAYEFKDSVDYDQERIEQIEVRLNTINRLLNKHKVMTDVELIDIEKGLIDQINDIESLDHEIDKLNSELKFLIGNIKEIGHNLSINRKAGADKLEKEVHQILTNLSMKNAQLKIDISNSDIIRNNGLDKVNYLFSANKGSTFLPIVKVASGGELSRLNLAIKSTIAGAITLPTLIFDEIDSGVSGQVSLMMGSILKQLARNHQTICITHSPQIAAQAHQHFHIYKIDRKDRTVAMISDLNKDERLIEIAKMLSGDPPSSEAINNAKQLLELTN